MTTHPDLTVLKARCAHFGECGGCLLQDTPYEEQLLQKEAFVKEQFAFLEQAVAPIIPSASPWHYRNKMEFSFSQSLKGEKFLGLMIRKKRGRVVNLDNCFIAPPWFTTLLKKVYSWWLDSGLNAYHHHKDLGSLRTLIVREGVRTGQKMVVLTVSGNAAFALSEDHIASFKEIVLCEQQIDSLILRTQIIAKKQPTRFEEQVLFGQGYITESIGDLRFKIRPSSFFQPHTVQAEQLYRKALQLINFSEKERLLDLYCGTGTLGIFAANKVEAVIGIELNNDAIEDAKENIAMNNITNMEVIQGDVATSLPQDFQPTTIIVDPPRAGLSPEALEQIATLHPKKILYISCNPITQAQNIKELLTRGYKPTAIQPVDQFPHTPHVENIVALERQFCYPSSKITQGL